jgi:polyisoprenoid-binding protein YceI
MKRAICSLLLLAGAAVTSADAAGFTVRSGDQSSLSFVYRQMGVPVEGRFTKYSARITFDPAEPAAAKASLELDLTSTDAGSAEANDELAGKAWFDTKAFPKATFVSERVKALGNGRFEVSGRMTIKGRSREVSAPFAFTPRGDDALFEGAFVLKRADFAIGEGVWADFGTVANEVQVKFRFLATTGK